MKLLVFMQFPLMFFLILIAKPLFELLFTSKWNDAVPYFQLLCFSGMLLSMHNTNLNILKAIGKSNIFLYLEVAKKVIGLLALIVGMQFGVMGMVAGIAVSSYLSLFLNAYYSGGKIGYGVIGQMKDVFPAYFLAFSLALALYIPLNLSNINNYLYVSVALFLYSTAYLGLAKLFKFEAFALLLSIFNDKIISRLRK
jgi:O-antigen/teichoic acid export membrane protein